MLIRWQGCIKKSSFVITYIERNYDTSFDLPSPESRYHVDFRLTHREQLMNLVGAHMLSCPQASRLEDKAYPGLTKAVTIVGRYLRTCSRSFSFSFSERLRTLWQFASPSEQPDRRTARESRRLGGCLYNAMQLCRVPIVHVRYRRTPPSQGKDGAQLFSLHHLKWCPPRPAAVVLADLRPIGRSCLNSSPYVRWRLCVKWVAVVPVLRVHPYQRAVGTL